MANVFQANVLVSFYPIKASGSAISGRPVIDLDNPIVSDVPALMQDMAQALEPITEGRSDAVRPMDFRMVVEYRDEAQDWLKAGIYLRVTHKRHPMTRSWRPVDVGKEQQFYVGAVNVSETLPLVFYVGLARSGGSG